MTNWTLIESTTKACLWDTGSRFVVTIGWGKKKPSDEEPPFRRDSKGLLILKQSSWRYPYTDNREEMLFWADLLYQKHA